MNSYLVHFQPILFIGALQAQS